MFWGFLILTFGEPQKQTIIFEWPNLYSTIVPITQLSNYYENMICVMI